MDKVQTNKQKYFTTLYTPIYNQYCSVKEKNSLVNGRGCLQDEPVSSSFLLKTPEELQRQFIREKHGGAHGETSNGVD